MKTYGKIKFRGVKASSGRSQLNCRPTPNANYIALGHGDLKKEEALKCVLRHPDSSEILKFVDHKECDENEMVESIRCYGSGRVMEVLKRDYAKFIVKEERDEVYGYTEHVFELVNNDLERNCRLLPLDLFRVRH
ncbi:hypothetical protein DdX_18857 [Ditylenchus destructor]|uniref:Uncharacterized protein n=1 Tax=Ditylenchus destructor TaxID=166010 RepID=A0AAD4QXW9_9BILA|nr:hypothetical protein DdX_18857 [Ditylenchus destructor]